MENEEAQSRAIVSHAPGMVFQYILGGNGVCALRFLSDQCVNVLGVTVEALQANPALFEEIILWKDRKSLRDSRGQ